MLYSENVEVRIDGTDLIVKIRGDEKIQTGDKNVRARKTPEINPNARTHKQLIDWTNSRKPFFTCDVTTKEVKQIIFQPLSVLMVSQLNKDLSRLQKQQAKFLPAKESFISGQDLQDR